MGFDKALLRLPDGTPLLRQNAEKLAGLFGRVAYMAEDAGKLADKAVYGGFPVVADRYPETGPMGAVCTALEAAESPWVFALACDMPAPDLPLITELAALRGQHRAVLCRHGAQRHLEPLFAFYHRDCIPLLRQCLAQGRRGLRQALAELDTAFLEVPPARARAAFLNLNTQAELEGWLGGSMAALV